MDENLAIPVAALLAAFFAARLAGPRIIALMHRLKFGQNINEYTKAEHAQKQGTPTMGGLLFVVGIIAGLVVACLLSRTGPSSILLALVFLFLSHVGIGFMDDYLSIKRGKNLGLKAREKLALQLIVSLAFMAWTAASSGGHPITAFGVTNPIVVPPFVYYVVAILLIMGMSNATNLADGLDGLAGGLAIPVSIGLSLAAMKFTPFGTDQVAWFGFALAGAVIGFLWFNAHPAKIFMGDTGSLALGASFVGMALVSRREILMLLLSLVYLAELGSVILQVSYFKATHGKRIFKMTPLHHHFQKLAWPETQIVARFWIVGGLSFAVGMACLRYL